MDSEFTPTGVRNSLLILRSLERDMDGKFVARHRHIPAHAEVGSSEHDVGIKAGGHFVVRVRADLVDRGIEHDRLRDAVNRKVAGQPQRMGSRRFDLGAFERNMSLSQLNDVANPAKDEQGLTLVAAKEKTRARGGLGSDF